MDATCVPADIRYPNDLSLLNEAREKTEKYFDILYESLKGLVDKPRTYRRVARAEYLATVKKRKPGKKELPRAIRKQLNYVSRNLQHIDRLQGCYTESPLTIAQGQILETIIELNRQQKYMFDNKTHSVENRIVTFGSPMFALFYGAKIEPKLHSEPSWPSVS